MLWPLLLAVSASSPECGPEVCGGTRPRCPAPTHLASKPVIPAVRENLYFLNLSPSNAEISYVDAEGVETTHGALAPGVRRAVQAFHGDVWRARSASNGRLLLEHRVGAVEIRSCDCPQPKFVDCSKGPTTRSDDMVSDPVLFENRANEPVDLFFFNGTCEELVSWDEVGGVQPARRKPMLSTQGHSFRFRSAASNRFLMAHTLSDLVIRGCSDEQEVQQPQADGLASLRAEAAFFESEHSKLRESLAEELGKLALALAGSNASASARAAADPTGTSLFAVSPHSGAHSLLSSMAWTK